MEAINQSGLAGRQYPRTDSLFFKFQGSDSAMSDVVKGVEKVTKKHGGVGFEFAKSDKEAGDLWAGRKAALWAVMGLKENCKVWTTDVWYVGQCPSSRSYSWSPVWTKVIVS